MPECIRLGWQCIPFPIDQDHSHQWWKIPADFSGLPSMRVGYIELSDELFGPAKPRITGPTMVSRQVNQPFSFTITATASPTSFNANVPPPPGLVFTPPNQITGTPTTVGTTDVLLEATNPEGTGSRNLRINITPAPPVVIAWPAYYGPNMNGINWATNPTADVELAALGSSLPSPQVGSTMVCPTPIGSWGKTFAYPDTLPPPSSIMDNVAGNVTAAYTNTTVTLTHPGGGGETQVYRVYYTLGVMAAPVGGTIATLTI